MSDDCFNYDFQNLSSVPKMIKDYLSGALHHIHQPLFSKENMLRQAREKAARYPLENRKTLVAVLHEQMQALGLSERQKQNLKNLANQDSFTIVTGHQLNLFTGPAYFIYKILQTIKTADFLNQNDEGVKFVPLFWMATEDHDFEEINHFKTENHYYFTEEEAGDAVGRISITDNGFIEAFEKEFADDIYGTELIRWMQEAYRQGNTFAQATQHLVQQLFGDWGLLFLDGDDKRLKALVQPHFKRELCEQTLYNSSKKTIETLIQRYGKVQVNPREINLFYLRNNQRNRIEKQGNRYEVVDAEWSFTESEILAELERHPERFSPNAVLRAVYQEAILPNVLYIGGNAEVRYWLELKATFEAFGVLYPVLMPRNSFTMISEKSLKKAEKLGLEVGDFFGDYQMIVQNKLLQNTPLQPLLAEKEKEITAVFQELKAHAKATDKTFENLVDAEKTRQLKAFNRMNKRLLRAEKIVQGDLYQRYNLLFEAVNPGGVWQERVLNFSTFYAEEGRTWIQLCYENTRVDKPQLCVLVL